MRSARRRHEIERERDARRIAGLLRELPAADAAEDRALERRMAETGGDEAHLAHVARTRDHELHRDFAVERRPRLQLAIVEVLQARDVLRDDVADLRDRAS